MKLVFSYPVIFFCILLLHSCNSSNNKNEMTHLIEQPNENFEKTDTFTNTIILLDLSSRVRLPNQDRKDIAILQQIVDVFEANQRVYGFQISRDKLDIKIAFQNNAITQPFDFGDDLTIDMSTPHLQMNKPNFDVEKSKFTDAVTKLYQQAVKGPTTGSDIWNFFDDKLMACLINGDSSTFFKNKVIILTDGYLEFDNEIAKLRPKGTYFDPKYRLLRNKTNWQEQMKAMKINLKPCKKFENVEVLMLEVTPFNSVINVNELQVIQTIWENWFSAMNINSKIIETEDNSLNLKTIITNFLSK